MSTLRYESDYGASDPTDSSRKALLLAEQPDVAANITDQLAAYLSRPHDEALLDDTPDSSGDEAGTDPAAEPTEYVTLHLAGRPEWPLDLTVKVKPNLTGDGSFGKAPRDDETKDVAGQKIVDVRREGNKDVRIQCKESAEVSALGEGAEVNVAELAGKTGRLRARAIARHVLGSAREGVEKAGTNVHGKIGEWAAARATKEQEAEAAVAEGYRVYYDAPVAVQAAFKAVIDAQSMSKVWGLSIGSINPVATRAHEETIHRHGYTINPQGYLVKPPSHTGQSSQSPLQSGPWPYKDPR